MVGAGESYEWGGGMTRGELELAWAYDRILYYGAAPIKIQQLSSPWCRSEFVVICSAINPKGRQWRCSFDELSAIPHKCVGGEG